MRGGNMKALVAGALLLGAVSLGGCATKKYVNEQVGTVQGQVTTQDGRIQGLDKSSREALERATAAGKLAEGKFLYSVVLTDDTLKFAFGKSDIPEASIPALSALAERLKGENKNVFVEVQGHTDATGSPDYNMKLGKDRAESVRRYLNQQGVALNRLSTISYGEEEPVAPNNTKAGRAQNRRVVVIVLN